MHEFGLSTERIEEYARQGFVWAWPNVLLGSIVIVRSGSWSFIPAARQEQQRLSAVPAYIAG
ncbi:MAG: hypothetical protein WA366_07750 [Pseudolabrys sp.]